MERDRSAPDALVGAVLAKRYRVMQYLGSGGVGHVYMAEQIGGTRPGAKSPVRVAIKVLRAEHRDNEQLSARFDREADAASRVRDPRVLTIYDRGRTDDGLPFFSAELLEGLDLADTISFARTLAPMRAVRIGAGVAFALAATHAVGVVHRDVKPENIFLVHARDGRELVKLLDFGFAWMATDGGALSMRITGSRTVVGTPEYMSPEQAAGDAVRPSADLYAMGIVLYEMLTGRVPFSGEYPAIAEKHAIEPPPPMRRAHPKLSISKELEAVVTRALAKDPSRRHASATELAEALLATPEGRSIPRAHDTL
ncbi:serine/threonine-protein kinase [Polyangium aurulentum]|uniref:serine/threonine-protein kinase n=1 Tax=Polyangium aurulentum TaxID=2567896 RepID=UPI0010AE10DB|nr:serine/threonine-protein kinase [Polyangium aurulentum]UQA62736.1 serine/threonine protein kinase [Polyangium aurulentum]